MNITEVVCQAFMNEVTIISPFKCVFTHVSSLFPALCEGFYSPIHLIYNLNIFLFKMDFLRLQLLKDCHHM